jgi:type IV secretory pathway TraG/TraD family ATPase VirD4
MSGFLLPGHWLVDVLGLTQPAAAVMAWGINIVSLIWLLRSAVILGGRFIGAYHPANYYRWPRLPWRSVVTLWLRIARWYEQVLVTGTKATGRFAGVLATLAQLYYPGHVLLGRAQGFGIGLLQPVGISVERHLFMYAMTGAGKTVSLITLLATWKNSAFVIDPKAQITNALRGLDGRRWVVLDPYGISDGHCACFNAFDCIKDAMRRSGVLVAVLWAIRVAQALIVTPAGSRTPYFTDAGRGFVAGVILQVLDQHPPEEHTLPFVRGLIVHGYRVHDKDGQELTKGDEAHRLLLDAMQRSAAFEGAIAGGAAALSSAGEETAGNLRSTVQEQTKWLDIPAVRAALRASSFTLSDLKTRSDVVFAFTAPVLSIREELAPLSRLLTNMVAYTFEAVTEKDGQCLTVIDELPSQGHNETLEVMLAVARSYGQTVLGISQNVELMQKAYPKSWGTFSGEADAVFWMATNHQETAQHLSQVLGRRTLTERDPKTGRKSYRDVAVMDPDQVKRFLAPGSGNLIVTRAGARPLKLKAEPYFKALPVWKYAPDPAHRETYLRRLTRGLISRWRRARAKTNFAAKPKGEA